MDMNALVETYIMSEYYKTKSNVPFQPGYVGNLSNVRRFLKSRSFSSEQMDEIQMDLKTMAEIRNNEIRELTVDEFYNYKISCWIIPDNEY
jgi:hypothetical protein